LAWLILVVASGLAFTVPRFGVPHIRPGFNPAPLVVGPGSELVQLFRVRAGGLNEVSVRVLKSRGDVAVDAAVEYRTQHGVTVLRRASLAVAPSDNPQQLTFEFSPIQNADTAELALALRVKSLDSTGQVTVQAAEGHVYREGGLWLDGEALPADLVMRADATFAQPWRAFARRLRRQTGLPGVEWLLASCYLGAIYTLLRAIDSMPLATDT
jgi:hypothetical protein